MNQKLNDNFASQKQTSDRINDKIAKKINSGVIEVTIWNNEKDNKTFHSVSINKRYKTKEGSWKNTSSFSESDLPRASLALQKAYEFLALRG